MSDTTNVLDYLREQFARVNDKLDRHSQAFLEVKERLGQLEGSYASISRRVDRIDERLDRMERRLDAHEALT